MSMQWSKAVFLAGMAFLAGGYGDATQTGMILRLLMYGVDEAGVWEWMADIPAGRVYGVNLEARPRLVEVGLSGMGAREPEHW